MFLGLYQEKKKKRNSITMPYLLKLTGTRITLLKRGAPQMHLCKFDYSQYRTSPRDLNERVVIITKQISQDFLILDPVTKSSHSRTYTISELIATKEVKLSGVKKNRENIIAKSLNKNICHLEIWGSPSESGLSILIVIPSEQQQDIEKCNPVFAMVTS